MQSETVLIDLTCQLTTFYYVILAVWSEWSFWSPCSQACGGGFKTRSRNCIGNGTCSGNTQQTDSCNTQSCRKYIIISYHHIKLPILGKTTILIIERYKAQVQDYVEAQSKNQGEITVL